MAISKNETKAAKHTFLKSDRYYSDNQNSPSDIDENSFSIQKTIQLLRQKLKEKEKTIQTKDEQIKILTRRNSGLQEKLLLRLDTLDIKYYEFLCTTISKQFI